jgi:HlyD family secretion protein
MRSLFAVLTCVVLFSALFWEPPRTSIPTVSAGTVSVREVRVHTAGTLMVERPVGATEGVISSVFVVTDADGVSHRAPVEYVLRRVQVQYGRASASLIEVVGGLSAGDRIVVSDMRAWDAFERVRIRSR